MIRFKLNRSMEIWEHKLESCWHFLVSEKCASLSNRDEIESSLAHSIFNLGLLEECDLMSSIFELLRQQDERIHMSRTGERHHPEVPALRSVDMFFHQIRWEETLFFPNRTAPFPSTSSVFCNSA